MKNTNALILAAALLFSQSSQAAPSTVLDRVRDGYFLIAGFPSNVTSNGPPQDGLISLMDFFSTTAQSVAQANGVTTCEAVPATGTASGTVTVPTALTPFLGATGSVTITYQTPLVTIPAGWSGAGGHFAKRVLLTKSGGIAFAFEFNCGTNEVFTSISIPGDNITNSTRDINLYIKKNGAALSADFMMTVTLASRATLVDSQLVRLETTDGVTFKVWNVGVTLRDTTYTCGGGSCGDQYGYERSVIQGNSVTKMASLYAKFDKPTLVGNTAAKTASVTDSSSATAAVASHDFSASEPGQGQSIEKTGCVNFSTRTDPASGAYCAGAGASLVAPTTGPLAHAAGSFTVDWVKTTLPSKMVFAN